VSDKPILFSGQMVRALLDGRKTQTRRAIKPQPGPNDRPWWDHDHWAVFHRLGGGFSRQKTLLHHVGDRLWVRESLEWAGGDQWIYGIDGLLVPGQIWAKRKTVSSIHMPRWASRLTLIVEGVKVERLQDITPADAIAEGMYPSANSQTIDCATENPRDGFSRLWDSINGPGAWESNPWVAAISFRVIKANIDQTTAYPAFTKAKGHG